MKPAFGYLRVSGQSQVEGDGFPRQRATVQKWAKANGYQIVRWFEEKGISGVSGVIDRPAFAEMMMALMSNGTRTVIVEKLDRLARDPMIQEHVIRDFRERQFELISATEPDLCQDDPTRELLRIIMGAISQYDKKMLVIKMQVAKQRKKAEAKTTGWSEGRKPFGTRDGEEFIVARMQQLRSEGQPWEHIARTLNAENLKPRKGTTWFPATVRRIVLHA